MPIALALLYAEPRIGGCSNGDVSDMVRCPDCNQEPPGVATCGRRDIDLRGERYRRVRFGEEHGRRHLTEASTCRDCGVHPGGLHHLGCELETCPRCRAHLGACGCDVPAPVLPLAPRRPPTRSVPG